MHIGPDERATLARIPQAVLFKAPGLPKGHMVMGYDGRGHCPMFVDGCCSIYDHRPRTCRTYDCRVFPAAGVTPDGAEIAAQAQRWSFDLPTPEDVEQQRAVRAAAAFLHDNAGRLPLPQNPTQVAYLAARVHDLFVDGVAPALEAVEARLRP